MDKIKLHVIGCGDAFSSGGNLQTCFYFECSRSNFLLDCGVTSVAGLKRNKIEIAELDFIIISHLHGDHFGGLQFILLDTIQNPRAKDLRIIGPLGIEEKTWALFDLMYPGSAKSIQKDKIIFESYNSLEEISFGNIKLLVYPVIHTAEVNPHGLRLAIDDKVISYSGDTEWCANLVPLAKCADLFICECNFLDREVKGHLNYRTIVDHIHILDCKSLLLTHLGDDILTNRNIVTLPIAEEGMVFTI